MQLGFLIDTGRCVGCETCTVACKNWNNLEPAVTATPGTQGPIWRRISTTETGTYPTVSIAKVSMSCNHCGKPACAGVCPTGAITKRADDGVVVVDQAKCIGCKACLAACPFAVPQFGTNGKMQKCTFCLDRVAQGKQPACVTNCPAKALFAGSMEELTKLAANKAVQALTANTQPSLIITKR